MKVVLRLLGWIPGELSRADLPSPKAKWAFATPTQDPQDGPGICEQFLSQSASPPSSHLWKGPAASISPLGKSGSEDQMNSTLPFHDLIIYFKWEASGFFPLGMKMIKSAIWCPGEEVTKIKFSTKIIPQSEICFLVTNSVIMLSDACFHFVIGSAGIISLLSVFNQTDCNQPHVFIVFFMQLAFWLSWVPAVNGWELCLFSCLHSHTTDFITALHIWIWVLIDSIPHI